MFDSFLMTYAYPEKNLKPEPYYLEGNTRRYRFVFPFTGLREQAFGWLSKKGLPQYMPLYDMIEHLLDECYALADLSSACRIDVYVVEPDANHLVAVFTIHDDDA